MNETFDVAIVGAGSTGLTHAAAAHTQGLRVVVIEQNNRILGATVRGSGHITIDVHIDDKRVLANRSRELLLTYAQRACFWIARRGTLAVATAEDEHQVLRESGIGRLLSERDVSDLSPMKGAIGGALLKDDVHLNPREAAPALASWLATEGVTFLWSTGALGAEPGTLATTRGAISAERIIFCTGHYLAHTFPAAAIALGLTVTAHDMLLMQGVGLEFPIITGSALLRHDVFAATPAADQLRARITAERPDIIKLDADQTYTEVPGLGLIVGSTRTTAPSPSPFQEERCYELLARLTRSLFGLGHLQIEQRWQRLTAASTAHRTTIGDGIEAIAPLPLAVAPAIAERTFATANVV
ncbi:NAD(P)/FAD-dependent oxidoreductase [Microbacterium amylolyticum]|uniref:FAD dependent oxidoreductase TIGR03364 n=1 Tax=Microbacterium amylolyticum TaxID=936337 RepID=A0ABS4ZG72_9MICO|nr:FAD-dependent oxidoreductase [Microbacterium amylolyticum]MBP2436286.1 FAD dependent oxidoreductase TIGR03364 [Microbacterium amylolyticum]